MKLLFENWRSYLLEMANKEDSRNVAKAVILRKDDKVLLLKSAGGKFSGQWDLPGGHLHELEDPLDGLKREVKEETGLTLAQTSKLFKDGRFTYYRASLPDGEIKLSEEHSSFAFYSHHDILKKDFETSQKFKDVIKKAFHKGEKNEKQ
tara:strand:+ start:12 stop:458 length:447 start_codon:yes stop_codon:yes gene_type:complete